MIGRMLGAAAAAVLGLVATTARASDVCDRACLQGLVDQYIAAMVAHDPGRLPLALGVKFTENGQELRLGDGLWGTASGAGHYKLYVADPEDGQVGFYGTVFENGSPVLLALRLKVDYGQISEVETIVARGGGPAGMGSPGATMEKKGEPRPQFLQTLPAGERSREDLVRVANAYFTGLGRDTGRNTAPFWPSCQRLENGFQTTNNPGVAAKSGGVDILAMSCEEQQKSGFYPFVTAIRNRRFPVVDRERGLVMSFAFFEHAGVIKTIRLTNGTVVPSPIKSPTTLEISETFQIHGGRIDQVEAVLNTVPYGMKSAVWDAPWVKEQPDLNVPPAR